MVARAAGPIDDSADAVKPSCNKAREIARGRERVSDRRRYDASRRGVGVWNGEQPTGFSSESRRGNGCTPTLAPIARAPS